MTRKLMTIHKALHLREDVGKLCVSRKWVQRGLASIKDCADAIIQDHARKIKKITNDTSQDQQCQQKKKKTTYEQIGKEQISKTKMRRIKTAWILQMTN